MKRHYAPRSPSAHLGVQLIPVLGRESSVEEGLATLAIVAAVACQKAAAANFGTYDRFTTEFIEAFKDASRLVAEASNG